jgi:hypothetical protein
MTDTKQVFILDHQGKFQHRQVKLTDLAKMHSCKASPSGFTFYYTDEVDLEAFIQRMNQEKSLIYPDLKQKEVTNEA